MPVAIVTGANHGIGASTAVALGRVGIDVLISYLRLPPLRDPSLPDAYDADRGQQTDAVVAAVEAAGARAVAEEADLADPTTPARLFDVAEERLGPVSVVVNNASGWKKDSFVTDGTGRHGRRQWPVSADTFDAQFHVDARGGALLIAELARRHRDRGATWGRVVSLTSGGPMGFPGEVSYGAAKAALESYTLAASTELAPLGITANVVYPPVTDTGWVTDDVRDLVAASDEHHHVAAPEEVAEVIAWLCTDAARLVTGNVIRLR